MAPLAIEADVIARDYLHLRRFSRYEVAGGLVFPAEGARVVAPLDPFARAKALEAKKGGLPPLLDLINIAEGENEPELTRWCAEWGLLGIASHCTRNGRLAARLGEPTPERYSAPGRVLPWPPPAPEIIEVGRGGAEAVAALEQHRHHLDAYSRAYAEPVEEIFTLALLLRELISARLRLRRGLDTKSKEAWRDADRWFDIHALTDVRLLPQVAITGGRAAARGDARIALETSSMLGALAWMASGMIGRAKRCEAPDCEHPWFLPQRPLARFCGATCRQRAWEREHPKPRKGDAR